MGRGRPDAEIVHLDTHVVVWLYAGDRVRLAPCAARLQGAALRISPMVELELCCLHEVGRLAVPGPALTRELKTLLGLRISSTPWSEVVRIAAGLAWTRDPFDRLIAAHALVDSAPLVRADTRLLEHLPVAVWA